jgi:2-iminobutanoate/2-iminopropanoate deaminase
MNTNKLKRGAAASVQMVPGSVCVGDYVFTSSIYPVDGSGQAIGVDSRLGETGPSLMEVQTRFSLNGLNETLKDHGSSLANILKVNVHLAKSEDFYEFKNVWKEFFPENPPARTTVQVGDTFPFRGVLLSIDAIALSGASKLERVSLSDPEGDDPLEAEWAPHAVRAGNLVFCSGFTASDFKQGIAVGRPPGFPNYGSNATMQAEYVFERLNRVLATAGTSLSNAMEAYLYETDLQTFNDIDTVWRSFMQPPPCRASMGVEGLIVPGACFVADLTVWVPEGGEDKQESQQGVDYHPVERRKVNFTPTLKAGPWLFVAGKTAGDMNTVHTSPAGLPNHFSDIEVQTDHVLDNLTRQIEENGSDWEHCHQVRVWLVEPHRDYRGFMRVWKRRFPDLSKAPTLAYVPSTGTMYPGPLIEIDPTCVIK